MALPTHPPLYERGGVLVTMELPQPVNEEETGDRRQETGVKRPPNAQRVGHEPLPLPEKMLTHDLASASTKISASSIAVSFFVKLRARGKTICKVEFKPIWGCESLQSPTIVLNMGRRSV